MTADSMFIEFCHYDSNVCISISTTRKDQKVAINNDLLSGCLLMIASYPEVSVIPLKTGMKFVFILPGSLHFLLYCSYSIAKGSSLGNFILLLYPIGAPW